jgi:hypothetical protein
MLRPECDLPAALSRLRPAAVRAWVWISIALAAVGCGTESSPARATRACEVRLPTAHERAQGAAAARRYERLLRRSRAVLRALVRQDDGSRRIDPKQLRAGQLARREQGFPASRATTRAVIVGSPDTTHEYGFPATLAEFRLLEFRNTVDTHTRLAQRYARQCLRDRLGGVYFGGDTRGQYVGIALTTVSASIRATLDRRSAMGARFLRVPHVRYTHKELLAAQDRISAEVSTAPDFDSIASDISDNEVVLRIHPFTDTRAEQLETQYGDVLLVVPANGPE